MRTFIHINASLHCFIFLVSVLGVKSFNILDSILKYFWKISLQNSVKIYTNPDLDPPNYADPTGSTTLVIAWGEGGGGGIETTANMCGPLPILFPRRPVITTIGANGLFQICFKILILCGLSCEVFKNKTSYFFKASILIVRRFSPIKFYFISFIFIYVLVFFSVLFAVNPHWDCTIICTTRHLK